MINPPMRGPGEKVGGLYHFGRMLDKIRLHLRGKLPEEYRPNYGWGLGLDGFSCGFLGVAFEDVEAHRSSPAAATRKSSNGALPPGCGPTRSRRGCGTNSPASWGGTTSRAA